MDAKESMQGGEGSEKCSRVEMRVEVMMREQTKNVSMCHGKVAQWGTKH